MILFVNIGSDMLDCLVIWDILFEELDFLSLVVGFVSYFYVYEMNSSGVLWIIFNDFNLLLVDGSGLGVDYQGFVKFLLF